MNQLQIYKRIMILSVVAIMSSFILAGICLAQDSGNSNEVDEVVKNGAGDTIKNFWENRALPCFVKAGDWFTNLWQSSIKPKVDNAAEWAYSAWTQKVKPFAQDIIDNTKNFFGNIVGTDLGKEIEKEEQEIKQESPYLYKIIERYRRFKEYLWGTNSTSTQETNENSK